MKGQTLGAFVKLVIFAVVTILATLVLAVTISNRSFGATHTFRANFVDATSLISGNDVRIAGVRVGTVKSVKVVKTTENGKPDNEAQVTFTVDTKVPVTTSTDVAIRYQNLVGQRYVALVQNAGNGAPQPTSQVIPTARTAPALDLTALFNGFRPLFQALTPKDVNSFASEIIATLQGEGGTVTDLVAKSASLTNTVANRDAVIGQVVDNLNSVLGTVEKRDAGLSETVVQLQRLVSGLASDRNTIAASLGNIDNLASNSATFIQQVRPYLPADITSLSKIAHSLNTTKNCPGYFTRYNDTHKTSVPAIPRYANNSCKGPNTLNEFLHRVPSKITAITRTATYGAYFNFYLCDLELGGVPGQTIGKVLGGVSIQSNSPACER